MYSTGENCSEDFKITKNTLERRQVLGLIHLSLNIYHRHKTIFGSFDECFYLGKTLIYEQLFSVAIMLLKHINT